jgi:sporulation protein YlmC with PRC-barrel domain
MKKQTSLALALFAMPLVVIAQSGQGSGQGSGQQGKTGQDKTGQDKAGQDRTGQDKTMPGQSGSAMQRSPQLHRSDDLIGAELRSAQGDSIGSVEDVFVNSNGEANYAVLSCEGEGKNKLVVVPLSILRSSKSSMPSDMGSGSTGRIGGETGRDTTGRDTTGRDGAGRDMGDSDKFTISIDKERLRTAPSFEDNDWPKGTEVAAHFDEVDRFFRNETSMTGRPISASVRGPNTMVLRASKLEGRNIENASGEKVGDIQQIVFDTQNGRVAYVAVSMGGFLGVGDKLVAVPWEAINVRSSTSGGAGAGSGSEREGDEKLILETSKDKLSAAPEFKSGDESWREMSDPNWMNRVYSHFSVRPYWQQGSTNPSQPPPKDG